MQKISKKSTKNLKEKGLIGRILVDCSHANSGKKYFKQEMVWNDVIQQVKNGNQNIIGMMLESNIHEGNQELTKDLSKLKYGVSITDACVSWEKTEKLLEYAFENIPSIS